MKARLFAAIAVCLPISASAQTPSPAQMGITHSATPEVLQTLDASKTWVPLGTITGHTFTPIGGTGGGGGGGGSPPAGNVGDLQTNTGSGAFGAVPQAGFAGNNLGWVDVTGPAVGMKPTTTSTPIDNCNWVGTACQTVQTLMNAVSPSAPSQYAGSTRISFPATPGQNGTFYYFSQSLILSRSAEINCNQGSGNQHVLGYNPGGVVLVFAPGVDGVTQANNQTSPDGGNSSFSQVNGCNIQNLGQGLATLTGGGSTFTVSSMQSMGPIPPTTWGPGDGIIAIAQLNASNTGMLGIQPGAYIDSVAGNVLTLHAGFSGLTANGYAGNFVVWRLPAALAYNVTTTAGSATVTITGGPQWALIPGDVIWSDAFPFGALVNTVTGSAGAQTITIIDVTGNNLSTPPLASVSHPSGSGFLWKVPTAINRQTTTYTNYNALTGWPIAIKEACESAVGHSIQILCSTSRDVGNQITQNMVGRWISGNNTATSLSQSNYFAAGNYLFDIMDMGTLGSTYIADLSEGVEDGPSMYGVVGNCQNQNYSFFLGVYAYFGNKYANSGAGTAYCMNALTNGGIVPPVAGAAGPVWYSPADSYPIDASAVYSQGNQIGAIKMLGNGGVLVGGSTSQQGYSGASGSNVLTIASGSVPSWIFATSPTLGGMLISDKTTSGVIPAGAYIMGKTSTQLILSKSLTASLASSDLLLVGANAMPCVGFSPGTTTTPNTMWFDKICGTPTSWWWGYNGNLNAWGYQFNSVLNPTMLLTGSDYVGYLPNQKQGNAVFYYGLGLGGGGATGTERQLDSGTAVPTTTSVTLNATGWFTKSNLTIPVSSCTGLTGVTFPNSLWDGASLVGTVASCNANQPTITLSAAASVASLGSRDALSAGATVTAQEFWTTNNVLIPVSTCTGVVLGPITDTSNGGASIGTVSSCANQAWATLTNESAVNSTGATDSLGAYSRRQGDVRFNTNAAPGGTVGWADTNSQSSTPFNPFGLISLDPNGYTWPIGKATAFANLPACSGTQVGSTAVITNGASAPGYLTPVGTLGTSTRKLFCDTTGWLYD